MNERQSLSVSEQTILICLLSFAERPRDTTEKGLKSSVLTNMPLSGCLEICPKN